MPDTAFTKWLNRKIADLIQQRGEYMSLEEVADFIGIKGASLSHYRKGMERAGLEKRRRLMESINLRVALIDWDIQAWRLRYRVTCGVGEPREFEISKNRHP